MHRGTRRSIGIAILTLAITIPVMAMPVAAQFDQHFVGDSGNDSIRGTSGRDRIRGLGGDDTLRGLNGRDLLLGGTDDDRLLGGGNHDELRGGPGRDHLAGGRLNDLLNGGPGRDTFNGGPGDDEIRAANDGSRDQVNCGEGNGDIAFVDPGDTVVFCERVRVRL